MGTSMELYASSWFKCKHPAKWLVLVGQPGCGKTHVSKKLAYWACRVAYAAREHWKRLPLSVYANWLDVASPEKCDDDAFRLWLQDVDEAGLVILDDIGTETDQYKTKVPTQRLCTLLNRCERKWFLATTNIQPQGWAEKWDVRVEDRMLKATVLSVLAPSFRSR